MGINFSSAKTLSNLIFQDCKLDLCVFNQVKIPRCQFIDCSLKNSDFSNSDLQETSFSGSHLREATFQAADLRKADLRECKDYIIDPRYTQLKGAQFSFPEALSLLKIQEIKIDGF